MNKFLLITLFICCSILTACLGTQSTQDSNNYVNQFTKNSGIQSIPTFLVVTAESHGNNKYYTTNSDAPYYTAISVKNTNKIAESITVQLPQINSFNVIDSTLHPELYASNQCTSTTLLNKDQECEIIFQANNPTSPVVESATASIASNGVRYFVNLIKTPLLYAAGNFSKTYGIPGGDISTNITSGGSCGINGNTWCPVIEYNLANNTATKVATTDGALYAMTVDNSGRVYVAGDVNYVIDQNNVTESVPANVRMIVGINSVLPNPVYDFIQTTTTPNAYPNSMIYALGVYANNIYIAGGFTQIGSINEPSGYPLVNYDLKNNVWQNALGAGNTPDQGVTAISFESSGNMFISGFYQSIGNTTYVSGNDLVLNRCSFDGTQYNCPLNTANANSISNGSVSALSIDPMNNLYVAGTFNQLNDTLVQNSYPIFIGGLVSDMSLINWNTSLTLTNFIYSLATYSKSGSNYNFFTAGTFEQAPTINADTNQGTCGNGTQSCLIARYESSAWSKVFTTDSSVNVMALTSRISARVN